jgi:hypothetical protein
MLANTLAGVEPGVVLSIASGLDGHVEAMSLTNGVRLGGYQIIAPLGTGGMGEVYRARDTRLKRESRLKYCPTCSPATANAKL